jgi:hypothetical protein
MLRLTVLVMVFIACGSRIADAADCERACLKAILDQYLAAVVKHDPAAAPLSLGSRETQNAIAMRPGNGAWKTVTGLGKVQRKYADAVSGQAAYYGILDEGATSAIVTIRIRVEDRKITEAEWYLGRRGDPGLNGPNLFDTDYLTANPPPDRIVPKAQRVPREALLAIVNSYFDGITSHDGSVVLAHPGCNRVENGVSMTGRRGGGAGQRGGGPAAAPAGAAPAGAAGGNDCVSGFAGLTTLLVAARRFPVVDEEAGIVLATAVFIRPPGSTQPRNVFSEWFIIDDGKIRNIYTAMFYPGPGLPVPNWPPYEGNWPVPAQPAPAAPPAPPRQ